MNVGDKVMYREGEKAWPGTVAGIEGNVVLFEFGIPTQFLQTPWAAKHEVIDERMYLDKTSMLAYGLVEALRDANKLPSGKFVDTQGRLYSLDRPMKISDIKKFCSKNHSGEPHCWWHGLMMTAVPIDEKSKYFGSFEEL